MRIAAGFNVLFNTCSYFGLAFDGLMGCLCPLPSLKASPRHVVSPCPRRCQRNFSEEEPPLLGPETAAGHPDQSQSTRNGE